MFSRKFGSGWRIITEKDLERIKEEERKRCEILINDSEIVNQFYWKRNLVPVLTELFFVFSCFFVPESYFIYTTFIFYLVLFLFYVFSKHFSFKCLMEASFSGGRFWAGVAFCSLSVLIVVSFTFFLTGLFPEHYTFFNFSNGFIFASFDNWIEIVLFIITSVFLAPVAGEVFYRRNLIYLETKGSALGTMIFSSVLYGFAHSLTPWGIFLAMLWSVPLNFVYWKTENVYLTMIAHFFIGFITAAGSIIFVFCYK